MENQKELLHLIDSHLAGSGIESSKVADKSSFIALCTPYIQHLLDHDFARLLQIMYRIDVSEKDFALTLHLDDAASSPAEEISLLIYNRLELKAAYRNKYK